MFSLIKQVLISLLSFSESLATKCGSLNDEPCMVRLTLKHYAFMISLDKCNGSCNVLSPKACASKKKEINVKVFNLITNKHENKAIANHISCDCKCKFDITGVYNSIIVL